MIRIFYKFILLFNLIFICNCYAPKLILISFDAFRGDYLHPILSPTLYKLSKNGVSTERMTSSYPTKTFPNHLSIATGLYEENHGVVNNKMYDPKFKSYFSQENLEERWWNDKDVKPIWNLNEDFSKERKTGSSMWPGSPVSYNQKKPTYVVKFERNVAFNERMDKAIEWLTLDENAANFVLLYFDQPDDIAHKTGPYSQEVRNEIKKLDDSVAYLLKRLKETDLLDETNIIILSDHGMSEIREERIVYLTKLCDSSDLIVSGVSPNLNIFLNDKSNLNKIYGQLLNASKELPFSVYKRGEIPAKFNKHRRIGDLYIEANDEYEVVLGKNDKPFDQSIADKEIQKMKSNFAKYADINKPTTSRDIIDKFNDFSKRKNLSELRYWGEHGYDNNLPNMRPLFLASGPAFKKKYIHRTPFKNIDIYSLACSVLHLNLDNSNRKPNDPYCKNDGEPWRVNKMLEPIKFREKDQSSGSDKSLNMLFILLLGSLLLVLLSGLLTCFTAAVSKNSNFKKRELLTMDLDEDVVDIDLSSQYERPKLPKNLIKYEDKVGEEGINLINFCENYDQV